MADRLYSLSINVPTGTGARTGRRFAFAHFQNEADAHKAISELNGTGWSCICCNIEVRAESYSAWRQQHHHCFVAPHEGAAALPTRGLQEPAGRATPAFGRPEDQACGDGQIEQGQSRSGPLSACAERRRPTSLSPTSPLIWMRTPLPRSSGAKTSG